MTPDGSLAPPSCCPPAALLPVLNPAHRHLQGIEWDHVAAVEGMVPNTYSDPIEGRFGYHVIQLMDLRQEVIQSLEEVQMEVRNILTQRKSADRLEDYVNELRAIAHLEVFDPAFADVEAQWNVTTADAASRQQ